MTSLSVKETDMSFVNLSVSQNQALEKFLRGTGRSISSPQAQALFGVKNLRARMSEFRSAGLKVKTQVNTKGRTTYSVSSRDVNGQRAKVFGS